MEEFRLNQAALRSSLLNRLLDAVKQCQLQFGGKKELATDGDPRVSCLIAQFEAVCHHGLRKNNSSSALGAFREVTERMTKLSLDYFGSDLAFWNFVIQHLSEHDAQRFYHLRNIYTDVGRGRAWIRCALNEKTLSRYVESFIANGALLEQFYEDWAFLRDAELNSTLPQITAGLSSILFAINIDSTDLNSNRNIPEDTAELLKETAKAPKPIINLGAASKKPRDSSKPKRKPMVNYVSFDEDSGRKKLTDQEGHTKRLDSERSVSSIETADNSATQAVLKTWNAPSLTQAQLHAEAQEKQSSSSIAADDEDDDYASTYSDLTEALDKEIACLRPMNSEDSEVFIPVISVGTDIPLNRSLNDTPSDTVSEKADDSKDSSEINSITDAQSRLITSLQNEISLLKRAKQDVEQHYGEKCREMSNENQMLRHQMINYVSAVQLLKSNEKREVLDGESVKDGENGTEDTIWKEYELKLIQVAQMHGELMEFNELLQRQLQQKNTIIKQIRTDLVAVVGPMVDTLFADYDAVDRAVANRTSDAEKIFLRPEISSASLKNNSIVTLWIPTVFLTGKGADVHHVYQVYMRIKDTEWNIYRRYSEFHQLHSELKQRDPGIGRLPFPKKKAVGKMDKKFVENRRKQLEDYLRLVLNHAVKNFPEYTSVPVTKETLCNVIPFLSDFPPARKSRSRRN